MTDAQPEATPVSTPELNPEQEELKRLWQEFGEKCFKVGQIECWIEQQTGHMSKLEKDLELAKRAARSAADKHDQLLKRVKSPNIMTEPEVAQ